MKILITGSAGFIGYHLAQKLLSQGHEVIGLDNINDYYDVNLKYGRLQQLGIKREEVEYNKLIYSQPGHRAFIRLNLEDRENLEILFREHQFDSVCHLAAQAGVRYSLENPYAYIDSNIVGMMNILECCRHFKVKHLAFASSSSVYGANEKIPFSTSDNVDHPLSLYAATKKSCELLAHSYSSLYGLPVTGLRFFSVYGPWGRPDMALFIFVRNIVEGREIDVYNHGKMKRDFTYIDDIINGVVRVLENPPEGDEHWDGKNPNPSTSRAPYRIYNIGHSSPVSLIDFIETIETSLSKKAKLNMLPMQPGDVPASWADVTDLQKDFDYTPSIDIKTGVHNFVKWYLDYYK
jgi:UDP-glucuronate 4-epimerase